MPEISLQEKSRTVSLPRVNQDFIGVSHQLEAFRKNRRQIQLEQRAVQNRVTHLEKQEMMARKNLMKKKEQLQKILSVKQRQQHESEEKLRLRIQRMQELEALKRQNEYMRIIHKTNLQSNVTMLRDQNRSDYTQIRKERLDGEYRKRVNNEGDLRDKRDQWISLNINKEKGKMKVDEFYKKKNKEHLKEYQSRIQNEDRKINNKISSIRSLEAREDSLRAKLQQTTLKNSRMEELIKGVSSRVHSPIDTQSIQAELYGATSRKNSKNMNIKNSNQTISFTDRQSTTIRDRSHQKINRDEVEENIEVEEMTGEQQSGFKILHKRRKNKHVNRYKQYQAF